MLHWRLHPNLSSPIRLLTLLGVDWSLPSPSPLSLSYSVTPSGVIPEGYARAKHENRSQFMQPVKTIIRGDWFVYKCTAQSSHFQDPRTGWSWAFLGGCSTHITLSHISLATETHISATSHYQPRLTYQGKG